MTYQITCTPPAAKLSQQGPQLWFAAGQESNDHCGNQRPERHQRTASGIQDH
jgi:hypothetical protein